MLLLFFTFFHVPQRVYVCMLLLLPLLSLFTFPTPGDLAMGTPYDKPAAKTGGTVAWVRLCEEVLQITGDSLVADELELTLYNAGLYLNSSSERCVVCMLVFPEDNCVKVVNSRAKLHLR